MTEPIKLTDVQKQKYAKTASLLTMVAVILTLLSPLIFGLENAGVVGATLVKVSQAINVFAVGTLGVISRWLEQHVDPSRPAVKLPEKGNEPPK